MELMILDGTIRHADRAQVVDWIGDNLMPADVIPALVDRWGVDAVMDAMGAARMVPVGYGIIPYSQRDPRWKDDLLGYSTGRWTVGNGGCAMTSSAMILSQVAPEMTPGKLNKILKAIGGFNGAELRWDKVAQVIDGVRYVRRRDWDRPLTASELQEVRDDIALYGPVVMEVDFKPETSQQEMHFVVALEMTADDVRIIDAWDGAETWLMRRYADEGHTLARAIWGVRVYDVRGALE